MLETRQLRYFVAVYEEQHVGRAAQRLFVSQPALSQQLKQLESQLDVMLFERQGKRIRATSAAHLLYRHAQAVLRQLQEAEAELKQHARSPLTTLSLGVLQTVNHAIVSQLIRRMGVLSPEITLHIEELSGEEIEQGLLDERLQIGIGFTPPRHGGIRAEELFSDRFYAVMPPNHKLAIFNRVPAMLVCSEPAYLLSRPYRTRQLWDEATAKAGLTPNVVAEMNRISGILDAIKRNGGMTVLPGFSAVPFHDPELVWKLVVEPEVMRTVGVLYLPRGELPPVVRVMIETVRELLQGQGEPAGAQS